MPQLKVGNGGGGGSTLSFTWEDSRRKPHEQDAAAWFVANRIASEELRRKVRELEARVDAMDDIGCVAASVPSAA